jgi:hypothetical protein
MPVLTVEDGPLTDRERQSYFPKNCRTGTVPSEFSVGEAGRSLDELLETIALTV